MTLEEGKFFSARRRDGSEESDGTDALSNSDETQRKHVLNCVSYGLKL